MPLCPVCASVNPEGAISCERCDSSLDAQATIVAPKDPNQTQNSPVSASETIGPGAAPSPDIFSKGSVIAGRYEIVRTLGQGGMGSVYQVFDRELERTIALKTIRPEFTGVPGLLRRLKQETLLTRQIAHPNVVRVFDLGVDGRLRFITMEFIEGEDLGSVLERAHKLSPKEALALMRQIASGLAAAHAEDVTHRDLKPRNILIGRDGRVRIADFGLARSLEQTGLTQTGAIIGTPHYMSPEQASAGQADARSDIFSLGVIFFEILAGELPFPSRTIAEALLSRTRDRARPLTSIDPNLPPWLAQIVMRCLELDPDRRLQTARELLEALESEGSQRSSQRDPIPGSAIQPGAMLGTRYRVEAFAGEGGMGKVYRAADLELDRTVALKIVHPDLAHDASYLARLKREISLASQISHKNVLRIHDLGEASGVRFVSMAWADGEDLAHLIRRSSPLAETTAVHIACEVCEGLAAAHVLGVIHRDLKPSNILLDSGGHACLADFGIAVEQTPGQAAVAGSGGVAGTPRYMSPEQAEGKPLDARSDLYSLGLILYEMTTGAVPFAGDSVFHVLALRMSEAPKSPKLLNPALSDELSRIILRCLERDPAKRYVTAKDLLADLQQLEAAPATRPATRSRRTQKLVLAAAALVVIAAASFWIFSKRRAAAPALPPASAEKYIAVLPFRSLSADPNTKYEAEGIADSVSARLFSLSAVHPVSSAAVQRVNLDQSEAAVAQQLGANVLVAGTLQSEGDRLQVFVRLEDIQKKRVLWEGRFSGLRQDLFTLEDEVSTGVVDALNISPTLQDRERRPLSDTHNLPAYDSYLQGRDILGKQRNVAGATEALQKFQDAVNQDQDFALAWAGVADASMFLYRSTHDTSWAQKALLAARQSEQKNDSLPEVHFALGSVYSAMGRNAEAVEEIKRALKLAPNSDDGYIRLARAYLAAGQSDAAVSAAKKAVEMNPFYWYNHKQLGYIYQAIGRIPEALPEFKRQVELNPHDATGYMNIGAMYYIEGELKQSVPYFKKAIEMRPTFDGYADLGTVYYELGDYHNASTMAQKAVDLNPNSAAALRNLAQIFASAGQQANANATYDRGIEAAYKVLQVNPQNSEELGILAMCFAGKGDIQRARQLLARARAIDPKDRDLLYDDVLLDAMAHRLPDALIALQRALENGTSFAEVARDPALAELRRLPQFAALEKRFRVNPAKKTK